MDQRLKKLEEAYVSIEDSHQKVLKEKKHLEERNTELQTRLAEEEDKGKHLAKLKTKFEGQHQEYEDQLVKERQVPKVISFICMSTK